MLSVLVLTKYMEKGGIVYFLNGILVRGCLESKMKGPFILLSVKESL